MIFSEFMEPLKEYHGINNMPFLQNMPAEALMHKPYQGLKYCITCYCV